MHESRFLGTVSCLKEAVVVPREDLREAPGASAPFAVEAGRFRNDEDVPVLEEGRTEDR